MTAALLLVDIQADFLDRPDLLPDRSRLLSSVGELLEGWRATGLPVLHVHTEVRADGSDRMPHWIAAGTFACVAGTAGVLAPPEVAPAQSEALFYKRFFDSFGAPGLRPALATAGVKTVVLAGLYLHGCIRSSVLSAYESGLEVWVAEDAVGSTEALHAETTRTWLEGRAARFAPVTSLLTRFARAASTVDLNLLTPDLLPVACINGLWRAAGNDLPTMVHYAPNCSARALLGVPQADADIIAAATAAACAAEPAWRSTAMAARLVLLKRWRELLQQNTTELLKLMVDDVGKPLSDAREELQRGLAHIDAMPRIAETESNLAAGVSLRRQPLGCVALITPWNNPVAIALGKLAPALVFANTVVWKPAPEAARIAMCLLQALHAAGLPTGVVNLVQGGARSGRLLVADPGVQAVALTGSAASGRSAQALCTLHGKVLQAELGGNNACIVLADALSGTGIDILAAGLARAAFSYSGQRCTAIRRFVVERTVVADFSAALVAAVRELRLGEPADAATVIGPLISSAQVTRTHGVVTEALAGGARLLCGGQRAPGWSKGCWFEPTLLDNVHPEATVVQQETFGPLALIQPAEDLEHAITLANGVSQGLLAALITDNARARQRCREQLEVGILKLNFGPLALHPDAPFGGWKSSVVGPPEHGIWDRDFYSRPQAVYEP